MRIGVLGGIGPEASAEFYSKLIKRLQKTRLIKRNSDYPQIIINSIPAPELIYDEIASEALMPYLDGLKQLDNFGVEFIAMVCNTIHLYYEQLQSKIKTPIINLPSAVKQRLELEGIRKITVIGTPSTIRRGLYRFNGFENMDPIGSDIETLTNAIEQFNLGNDKQYQIQRVEDIAKKYLNLGAERMILGCTEFAVMLDKSKLPIVNTIDVLVDATIERFKTFK